MLSTACESAYIRIWLGQMRMRWAAQKGMRWAAQKGVPGSKRWAARGCVQGLGACTHLFAEEEAPTEAESPPDALRPALPFFVEGGVHGTALQHAPSQQTMRRNE
uniref:Uncharacterized protein n=1 Tax=Chrysotila carterae TaxID=13221 RepID=A0A7S4BYT9_CHRCT